MKELLKKLKDFESMRWSEIEGRRHHSIPVADIVSEAQQRLVELEHDDKDELFSIALTNLERLWGIRNGAVLSLLWWDENHQVCPSTKNDN